jgi:hypothetical protein
VKEILNLHRKRRQTRGYNVTALRSCERMDKPHLNRIWETYIEIPIDYQKMGYSTILRIIYDTLRQKVRPTISGLEQKGTKWYCFLFHGSRVQGDTKPYWHIRFEPREGIDDKEKVNALLSNYCDKTKTELNEKVESIKTIKGIDESLIKNGEIEEAWRILGEQSKWFMDMLEIHKEDDGISSKQIFQFLHFSLNMSQLLFACPCCGNIFHEAQLAVFEP